VGKPEWYQNQEDLKNNKNKQKIIYEEMMK